MSDRCRRVMLPNGFYKQFDQVHPEEIEFICYGVPRSGSTLVYQLVSGLYPAGVVKTHRYCAHRVKTIVSYRDFRDVTVSLWRAADPGNQLRKMTAAEVETFAERCRKSAEVLDRYFDRGDICPLRYEDFVAAPELIFERLKEAFGVTVPAAKRGRLIRRHSLANNQVISERLRVFSSLDARTQMHGNHIHTGAVGSWREFLDHRGAEHLQVLLQPWLTRYGYAYVAADVNPL